MVSLAQIASSAAGPQVGWQESLGHDLCIAHKLSSGVHFLWHPVASLGVGEMRTVVSSCATGGHRLAGVVFSLQQACGTQAEIFLDWLWLRGF